MSLYFAERVKEQESDDRASDKNVVFTFPWIIDFSIDNEDVINNEEEAAAETSFATSYKMASTYWKASLRNDYTNIVVKNIAHENWDGICFISYTLYYDDEMRFEFC
uniref:Uncharacterized protein n=1 Tax=Panagrolaimus sp. ES5 TaxID=591445 RepID=A0AC34FSX4_9BILA